MWLKNGEQLDSGVRIAFIFMVLVLLLCTGNLLYLVWCMKSMDQNLLAQFIAQEQKVYHTMKSVTSLDTWATYIFVLLGLISGVTGLAYFWGGSGGFMPSVYESTPFFPLHRIEFSHSLECAIGFLICGILLTVVLWILHSALHPSSHKPPLVDGLTTKKKNRYEIKSIRSAAADPCSWVYHFTCVHMCVHVSATAAGGNPHDSHPSGA